MKKLLIRFLLSHWIKAPITRRCVWTSEDAQHLSFFLESTYGKRFLLKLREAAADKSFGSVYARASEAVSAAAYARGFCDSLGLIYSLAKSLPLREASEYEPAEGYSLPGQPAAGLSEQSWSGFLGGQGVIAPK